MSQPRIGIPLPTSNDLEYNRRSWPQYAAAIIAAGGEPVELSLNTSPAECARLSATCSAFMLPGSPADVNPQKYGQEKDPATAPTDLARENVDELLLQDAHNLYKPLLCICYGTQSLNVWRGGTLVQDLATLPVNHKAGPAVAVAHTTVIRADCRLAALIVPQEAELRDGLLRLPVNSSHHQAVGIVGDRLRVVGRSSEDNVVEAIESELPPEHYVVGLQWHPERSVEFSATSRAIFLDFVARARSWTPRSVTVSVA